MKRAVQDVAIGTGAISTPLWLEPAGDWVQFVGLCCGLVLVLIRIYMALTERKNGAD